MVQDGRVFGRRVGGRLGPGLLGTLKDSSVNLKTCQSCSFSPII
jgi:hypothetical protein